MKKNKFLTFIFALIPGAGHMYLGYMKKGISVMTLFCGTFALIGMLSFEYLIAALPIIWFYSFFDTFRLQGLLLSDTREKDNWLFMSEGIEGIPGKLSGVFKNGYKGLGAGFIAVGLILLYQLFVSPILSELLEVYNYSWLYTLVYRMPTVFVAVGIIILGFVLLKGKKNAPSHEEDYKEYKGDKHE